MGQLGEPIETAKNIETLCYVNYVGPNPTTSIVDIPKLGIADTGASGNYIKPKYPHEKTTYMGPLITLGLPNGVQIKSLMEYRLAFPQLPGSTSDGHILPGLIHSELVSIGKMFGVGCQEIFNRKAVHILQNGREFITGKRDHRTSLWRPTMKKTQQSKMGTVKQPSTNSAYHMINQTYLVKYIHASSFSTVKTTWINAIQKRIIPIMARTHCTSGKQIHQ